RRPAGERDRRDLHLHARRLDLGAHREPGARLRPHLRARRAALRLVYVRWVTTDGRIQLERRGHVLLMGLDRAAKRNAFDLALWDGLCLAYGELDRDPELRVGVLHAVGDHFTGGLDLPAWAPVFSSGKFHIPDGGVDPLGLAGPRLKKPVVMAVQGICLTIGIELMLATDIRIAA